jgi:hypothetical protein
MPSRPRFVVILNSFLTLFVVDSLSLSMPCHSALAAEVRDRAVVSLTFDDLPPADVKAAADSAKSGKVADVASLTGSPSRTVAAFAPGAGHSLLLNSAQQQISIAHSEDLNRPDAVSVTGFFASMHPLNDPAVHGLFAKRKAEAPNTTNFGINFIPSADNFQLYMNDGAGFKVVHYSVKSMIGFRRRVHLAACFDHGDAPGADADADVDDLRVRLFVNGVPATPTSASGGLVDGATGWIQDVSLTKCISDAPMTIGSSFANSEMMRMVCDDIHIFAEALSDADAAALFREVAGTAADEISKEQSGGTTATAEAPSIVRVVPHALEPGKTARVVVAGKNLDGAMLHTGIQGVTAARVAEGSNADQAIFDVTVDGSIVPGRYPVRCVSSSGVSNRLVMSVDRVPGHADGVFTEANPATTFPIAVSGLIGSTEQKRIWFKGTAGQKIVAEAEARRIGSRLDPVIEIKSQAGTPLVVQWQQSELSGDARVVVTLPSEGLYVAELHDLQFAAPGGSPWRLLLGDLPPSSLAFPPSIAATAGAVRTVAADAVSEALTVRNTKGKLTIESGSALLPLPSLRTETATYATEPIEGTFAATPIDATMMASPFPPLWISGRIAAAKEKDSILLAVTSGQTLHFSVAARTISSALRAKLVLFNGDAVVAQSDGESGASDPQFAFAVPDKVTQLRLEISDLNGRGSLSSIYRIQVARTDRPAFVLTSTESAIRLPLNGSIPVRLSVRRQSPSFRYTGPIRLSLPGVQGVTIVPETIPAAEQDQLVIAMLTRSAATTADVIAAGQSLTIEGRAEGAEPVFATTAQVDLETLPPEARLQSLTLPDDAFVAGPAESVPATILLGSVPPVLFRGLPATIPVRVIPLTDAVAPVVRFDMITTEAARREDPNKPDSPLKPIVSLEELQFGSVSDGAFSLNLRVPADTPSDRISAAISAEFVSQPLAADSGSKAWTAPIMFSVADAAGIEVSADPLKTKKATTVMLTGSVRRHPLFTEVVTVVLDGLPQGWTAAPVQVAADQKAFSIAIAAPEAAAAGEVPNLSLRVQHSTGTTISKPSPVKIVVE